MKKKKEIVDLLKYKQNVKPHIKVVVNTLGYLLHDLSFITENQIHYLRVAISHLDKPIALADCETVSRKISEELDTMDLIPCAYTLEVESPGIENITSTTSSSFDIKGFGKVKVGEL